jgi:hypothetical protein
LPGIQEEKRRGEVQEEKRRGDLWERSRQEERGGERCIALM